jgi:hypothetical protein
VSEEIEKRESEQHALLFGVRRSVRYHVRRRQHFDRLDKFIKLFTTVGGIGTVVTLLARASEWVVMVYGALAGVFSTIDLVISTAEMARVHADLARDFIGLEKQMVLAGEKLTEAELAGFVARRLEIEAQEPPPLRVLDTICYNDLVRAMGYDKSHQKKVTALQKFFSPFFDWRLESTDDPRTPKQGAV